MTTFLIGLAIFAFTVIIHEFSHGYVAYRLGDTTAKDAGRLTLNPLKHIDPFWTVILPLVLIAVKSPYIFGMARPVPVNFMNLRSPKRDMILVAAAGPLSNLLLAILLLYVYKITGTNVLIYMILLNLLLGFFNLIPIPPLDGGRILAGLLPNAWAYQFGKVEPYGFLILIVLLMTGFVDQFIVVCMQLFSKFFNI